MAETKGNPDKKKIPTREPNKRTSGIFDNVRKLPHPVEEYTGFAPASLPEPPGRTMPGQIEPERDETETAIPSHPATQPPRTTEQVGWPATQPEQETAKPAKDLSRMPSRWNKVDKTFRIDSQLATKFKTRSAIEQFGMSEVVEDLIAAFIGGQPPSHPATHAWFLKVRDMGGQPHHDDMMIGVKGALKTPSSNNQLGGQPPSQPEDELLAFYARWTGNQITDYDRAKREELRSVPVEIAKVGILMAFYRAKRKINSFNYFSEEIRATYDESPDMDPRHYLEYQVFAIGRDKGRERVPEEERSIYDRMAAHRRMAKQGREEG